MALALITKYTTKYGIIIIIIIITIIIIKTVIIITTTIIIIIIIIKIMYPGFLNFMKIEPLKCYENVTCKIQVLEGNLVVKNGIIMASWNRLHILPVM